MTISSLIVLVFAVLYYFLFKWTDKNKKDPTDPAAAADKQETPAEEKEPIPPAASSPPPPPAAVPSFPQPQAKIKPSPAAEQRQAIKHTMKDVEELEKRFLRLYHRSYDYPDLRCGSFGSSEFSAAARETDLIEIKNEFIRTKEKINAGLDFLPGFLKHIDRSDPDKAYSILKANEKLFEVSAENSDELYREMLSLFSVVSFTENEHDEYYSKAVKALSGLSEAGTIDIKPSVEPHDLRFLNNSGDKLLIQTDKNTTMCLLPSYILVFRCGGLDAILRPQALNISGVIRKDTKDILVSLGNEKLSFSVTSDAPNAFLLDSFLVSMEDVIESLIDLLLKCEPDNYDLKAIKLSM